jgi:cell division protein FtsI/penicillin-binding protein 2
VTEMLVASVDDGVASNGRVEWYSIAGKTGTSQIAYRWQYETWIASTTGSFAGYAPAEDPRFVILVKLDRPRTSQYWGATSAYMFWELAKELLEYYSIPKKSQNITWE